MLFLFLGLLIGLLACVAMFVTVGFREATRSRLQIAADDVATVGARALGQCSEYRCFEESLQESIKSLARHSYPGARSSHPLRVKLVDRDENGLFRYPKRGIEIQIERGQYKLQGGESFKFQSIEGPSWRAERPGVPYLAANAVRVRIRVNQLADRFSGSLFGSKSIGIEVHALSVSGPIETTCVGPFAIPVCALLDNDGSFSPENVCTGDRFLGRADRFCPADDPECGRRPATMYGNCRGGKCSSRLKTYERGWDIPSYVNFADHFGLVGLPSTGAQVTESDVLSLLSGSGRRCVPATIGQKFSFLEDGLTGAALPPTQRKSLGDLLWRSITNNGLIKSSSSMEETNYFPPGVESELGAVDTTRVLEFHTNKTFPGGDFKVYQTYRALSNSGVLPEGRFRDYLQRDAAPRAAMGLCSSHRVRLDSPKVFPRDEKLLFRAPYIKEGIISKANLEGNLVEARVRYLPGTTERTPVWVVKVPVIANVESKSGNYCEGIEGSTKEPGNQSSDTFEIIGFVNLMIFDVLYRDPTVSDLKIFQAPFEQRYWSSSYAPYLGTPNDGCNDIGCAHWFQGNLPFSQGLGSWTKETYPGGQSFEDGLIPSGIPDFPNGPLSATGPNPWFFTEDYHAVGALPEASCNLFRSRITCDSTFIPSSKNSFTEGERIPYLVE